MNRYPLWKYAILVVALLIGVLYTLPNFFGEDPAVQVSAARSSVRVDAATRTRIEQALAQVGIKPLSISQEATSIKVRLDSTTRSSRPRTPSSACWRRTRTTLATWSP